MSALRRWLCARGRHAWRLHAMSRPRHLAVPYVVGVVDVVEGCARCGLRRTRRGIDVPRKVRA